MSAGKQIITACRNNPDKHRHSVPGGLRHAGIVNKDFFFIECIAQESASTLFYKGNHVNRFGSVDAGVDQFFFILGKRPGSQLLSQDKRRFFVVQVVIIHLPLVEFLHILLRYAVLSGIGTTPGGYSGKIIE